MARLHKLHKRYLEYVRPDRPMAQAATLILKKKATLILKKTAAMGGSDLPVVIDEVDSFDPHDPVHDQTALLMAEARKRKVIP